MIDPSIREKYTLTYNKTYIRPDINKIENKPLLYLRIIIFLILFTCAPLLKLVNDNDLIWLSVWIGNFVLVFFTFPSGKEARYYDMTYTSLIQEFVMTDKQTGEKHPGYALITAYETIFRGIASAAALASNEDNLFKSMFTNDNRTKAVAAGKKKHENLKLVCARLHDEELQLHIADMIVNNKPFYRDMSYVFFDKYRPVKKYKKIRIYAIPGYRGMEQKIPIPLDCGFEEAISDKKYFEQFK